jgi:apolipoprotein N-acyltransferase
MAQGGTIEKYLPDPTEGQALIVPNRRESRRPEERAVRASFSGRYPLAVLAGLLLAASFPKLNLAAFAWIAPALLLFAALGASGREAFCLGYAAGMARHLASLYWMLLIPGSAWLPGLGWIALSAYLALYPAVWAWLVTSAFQSPSREAAIRDFDFRRSILDVRCSASFTQRTLWALFGAALWVSLEMIQARLLTGFPWNLLGVSQHQILPLIQIASVTGVYGISFLIVWASISLLNAAVVMFARPSARWTCIAELILPLLALAGVLGFGFYQLRHQPVSGHELKVAFVQPGTPQTRIWTRAEDAKRFQELLELTERALVSGPDLLVWPEAAVPEPLRYHQPTWRAVTELARKHKLWIMVCADELKARPGAEDETDYLNSSFLINPDGQVAARYDKQHLLMFGEYVPLQRWLPFMKRLTHAQGGYVPGPRPVQFPMASLRAQASVLICYEDVLPQLVRGYVGGDTDFLVNESNNGWFGESAQQWQHAVNASFRAVENGVPLLACSDNGLTYWADANGRLRQVLADDKGRAYGAGFMTAQIPLRSAGEARAATFYNRHGDWFGWACLGFAMALPVWRLARRTSPALSRAKDFPPPLQAKIKN